MIKKILIIIVGAIVSSCVWCSSGCDYSQQEKPQVKKTISVGKGRCWIMNQCDDEKGNIRVAGWSHPLAEALREQDVFEVVSETKADYTIQIYDNTLYKFEDMCNMVLPLTLGLLPCMSTIEYNLDIEITDNHSSKIKMINFKPKEHWFGHILLIPFAIVDYHTGKNAGNKIPAISRHMADMIYEEIYN